MATIKSATILAIVCFSFYSKVSQGASIHSASIIVEGVQYFYDEATTLRNRSEAATYCQLNEACLAVVENSNTFKTLSRWLPPSAVFWIDGMDKVTSERFELTSVCGGLMSIDPVDMNITSTSCLSIARGADVAHSKIKANLCSDKYKTLCSVPLTGLPEPSTTTTTTDLPFSGSNKINCH